jgi:hypothetical protein
MIPDRVYVPWKENGLERRRFQVSRNMLENDTYQAITFRLRDVCFIIRIHGRAMITCFLLTPRKVMEKFEPSPEFKDIRSSRFIFNSIDTSQIIISITKSQKHHKYHYQDDRRANRRHDRAQPREAGHQSSALLG